MEFIHKAEKALEGSVGVLPSLPKDTKRGLFVIAPWVVAIAGALQFLAAYQLYEWAGRYRGVMDVTNSVYETIGGVPVASRFTVWVWLAIVTLTVQVIVMLVAFFKLRKFQKQGWDLVLLAVFINLAYGVIALFIEGRGLVGGLAGSLVGAAVGLYLLFQVRDFYTVKKPVVGKRSK